MTEYDFDALDAEYRQERAARLRAANTLAAARDPDQYGRANAIADRRGLPVDVVADNLGDFEQRERADELDALAGRQPEIGAFLSDPRRLALAKDDTGPLEKLAGALRVGPTTATHERTWGEFFSDLGISARTMGREAIASLGTAPRDAMNWINASINADASRLAGLFGAKPSAMIPMQESLFGFEPALRRTTDEINAQDRERLSFAQTADESGRPDDLAGTLGWYAKNPGLLGTDAAGAAGYMAAGGIVPGKTQLTIATQALGQASGAVEQVRQRLVEKGLSESDARAAAANVFGPALAIGIAAPNVVPGGASLERLIGREVAKGAASRVGRVAVPLVGEPLAEGGEEAAIQLAQNLASNDPAGQGVGGAFGMGAALGFGMALPPAIAGARSSAAQGSETLSEIGRIAESIRSHDRLQAITEAAAQSALARRSPADAEAFARQVGGEGSVYLKADDALVLFQDDRGALAELVGGEQALTEQVATGDVEIPMARWVARVAQRPNADELVRHARTEIDGLSPVEIEALDAQAAEYAARGTDEAAAQKADPGKPDARAQVAQDVTGQLVATGRYSPERAEAQGKLWGAAFTRLGEMAGTDPMALYQRHMGGIETAGAPSLIGRATTGVRKLFQGPALVSLDGREIAEEITGANSVEVARDWFKSNLQGKVITRPGFGDVRVSSKSFKELRRGMRMNPAKVRALPAIPAIIERGEYEGRTELHKERRDRFVAFHTFTGTVEVGGGERVSGRVLVGEDAEGNLLYDLFVNEEPPAEPGERAPEAEGSAAPENRYEQSLAPDADGVNFSVSGGKAPPRGQITIAPDRSMSISLLEKADASTFLHESAHFFLEVMRDIVADPNASPEATSQGEAILQWLGVESFDAIETEHHEKFARGFEQYLGEGKAPSLELQTVFAQFKAWILGVYRTLKGLNVELTDDARAMFDRLLASDEEVELAQVRQGMEPMVGTPDDARALGLTDAQFASYQAMLVDATEEARAEVMQKLVAAQRREATRWWKEERAAVRAEVDAAYEATPAVRALRILNGAQTFGGAPVPEGLAGMKLDRGALVAQYGDAYLKRLGRTYAKAGGVHPDLAAAKLGFTSGDALVNALANVTDTLARVDAEVDAIMRERHGDPMADGSIAEVAMDAAHNAKRVQALQFELDTLAKLAQRPAPTARELRALAERIVLGKTARTLRPNDYLAAERRAAREAMKAAAKGDYAAALEAKRQQALNAALYRQARDAAERAESTIHYLRKAATDKTRERVGKQAGKPYVDALDALLEGHEVAPVSGRELARRASLREWVARVQADGSSTAVSEELLARVESERVTNLADLTLADLADLREAVENLLHLARVKNRLLSAKGEREWEDAKAELVERLERQAPKYGRGAVSDADRKIMQTMREHYAAGATWLLHPETVIEWLDGGTTGPFHELLWDVANRAEEQQTRLNRQVGAKLQAALDALPKDERKALDQRWRIESLGADVSGHSILSALLNMGNTGNRDKLLRGGRVLGDSIVPFTEEQLAEMFSKLTAGQARLVQDVWDAVNSLWPEVVALEERLNGITPEKIEAQAFTVMTRDGPVPLRGGYYPAMYDPKGARAGQFSADEQAQRVLAGQTPIKASTSKGHTEARTDYAAPLLLDYHAVLTRHLDGVIGDIAYREVLRQFYRILGDADIRRMIDNRIGDGAAKGVQKALERGVTGNFALAGPLFGPLQGVADKGMTNISSAALGFRVPLALANVVTAPIMATARVKKRFLLAGFADYYGGGVNPVANMRRNAAAIHALSPMMATRAEARTVELRSIVATLRGERGLRAKMIELAMSVHQWIVPLAENAIWLSAYKQAQAAGASMEDARNAADKAIRQTQTKHSAKDLSMAEGGYMRPLMQFAGPLVIINNRLQESGLRGLRGDVKSRTQALGVWLAMAAGGAWIFELMMGRGPDDEDEDGDTDAKDWIQWAATKLALMPFAAIPIVRDVAGYADQGFMRGTPLAEAGKSLVDFGKQAWAGSIAGIDASFEAMGGDFVDEAEFGPARAARGAVNAAGVATGVPSNQLWRTGSYLMEVGTGDHVPDNPAADAYYLLQGRPKE